MLEKPNFDDDLLAARVQSAFGVPVADLAFLPLGNDTGTAVYRAVAQGGSAYFCKLRRGDFNQVTVALPHWLSQQGISQIIAPLTTLTGDLWAEFQPFAPGRGPEQHNKSEAGESEKDESEKDESEEVYALILYPFVEGINGYEVELSPQQWASFGEAMQRIHSSVLPPHLLQQVEREDYAPYWRQRCHALMCRVEEEARQPRTIDPITQAMVALLTEKREMIHHGLARAEQLAGEMAGRDLPFVLCHNDIHPGNLLVESPDAGGRLFVVDWDYPILAPKERDLMFIGGGQGFLPYVVEREAPLFYAGYGADYGEAMVDAKALVYYRYERAITDIAVDGGRILSSTLGAQDRAQSLEILGYYFLPDCPLEMAARGDVR